jgi:hypothetical protein
VFSIGAPICRRLIPLLAVFSHRFCGTNRNRHIKIYCSLNEIHACYADLQSNVQCFGECPPGSSRDPLTKFDTSCFSGIYVTGETINDSYFTRLHDRRNEKSKTDETRKRGVSNGVRHHADSPPKRPVQSNDGCESMSNNKTESSESLAGYANAACEPITNNGI